MGFFERYGKLCAENGYEPGSQAAAEAIKTNRGTISAWRTTGNPPMAKYLVAIADVYHVSADYLLERTDDPTDFAKMDEEEKKTTVAKKLAAVEENRLDKERTVELYSQLDEVDRGKVEAFVQGLLAQEKYAKRKIAL